MIGKDEILRQAARRDRKIAADNAAVAAAAGLTPDEQREAFIRQRARPERMERARAAAAAGDARKAAYWLSRAFGLCA